MIYSTNNTIANKSFTTGWASATLPPSFIVGYHALVIPVNPDLPLITCGPTITPLVRLYSSGGASGLTYVSAVSRDDAIAAAIGTPTTATKTTVVADVDTDIAKRSWDRIAAYINSSIFSGLTMPSGLTTPQFVWEQTTSSGETRYFATAAQFTLEEARSGVFVTTTNFADNAYDYQVSLYDATTKALVTISPILQDGNVTSPSIGHRWWSYMAQSINRISSVKEQRNNAIRLR